MDQVHAKSCREKKACRAAAPLSLHCNRCNVDESRDTFFSVMLTYININICAYSPIYIYIYIDIYTPISSPTGPRQV